MSSALAAPQARNEAATLWEAGKQAYEAGNFRDSARMLGRLVDHFPASPGYLEAHLWLGKDYLELGQAANAQAPLQYYIDGALQTPLVTVARLALGRAYLALKKFHEAYLISLEIERSLDSPGLPLPGAAFSPGAASPSPAPLAPASSEDLQAEALLIRAHALLGLHLVDRAESVADSARGLIGDHGPAEERGEMAWIDIRLKARGCADLSGPVSASGKPQNADEAEVRQALKNRGDCLLETMPLFARALGIPSRFVAAARAEEMTAFENFADRCLNPPDPLPLRPRDRSHRQLQTYRRELIDRLRLDCTETLAAARKIGEGWQGKLPSATQAADYKVFLNDLRDIQARLQG